MKYLNINYDLLKYQVITLIWEFTLLSILFSYDTTFGFVLTFAILQVFHHSREQDKIIESLII